MAAKYMRKDSEVEAIVWNTANLKQMRKFVGVRCQMEVLEDDTLRVWNEFRDFRIPSGHYLIRTTPRNNKKYSVMSMDEFEETYEKMYELIIN